MAALLETDCKQLCRSRFCCGRPSKHASWGAPHSLCSNFRWTHTCLSSDFSLFTETFSCVGSLHLFFSSSSSFFFCFCFVFTVHVWGRVELCRVGTYLGAFSWMIAVYIFSAISFPIFWKLAAPRTAHNLNHESLFLRSRCFPMSAGLLTKQDGEPASFKVLHMSPPFSPFCRSAHTNLCDPMGYCPMSYPDRG